MATFVRIGDQVFPCNDAGAAGLARFIASEHEAYNGLFDDAEKQLGEQGTRHAADVKAYEDLLAEAQERIDQKDKALAGAKESLAGVTALAEQYAEEADDLEEQLDEQPFYWFFWWASAIFAGLFLCSLIVHATR